jgi:xylulose-5-phosphate/fructose-6-phosphate phosphoketolase
MNAPASTPETRNRAGASGFATKGEPLPRGELRKMNAHLRATNYLSVGQIDLYANPLLRAPLTAAHVKQLVERFQRL